MVDGYNVPGRAGFSRSPFFRNVKLQFFQSRGGVLCIWGGLVICFDWPNVTEVMSGTCEVGFRDLAPSAFILLKYSSDKSMFWRNLATKNTVKNNFYKAGYTNSMLYHWIKEVKNIQIRTYMWGNLTQPPTVLGFFSATSLSSGFSAPALTPLVIT